MKSPRQSIFVWVLALATAGVMAAAVASWPRTMIRYQLHLLQINPSALATLISSERTSSQEEALAMFAATPEGQRRVFECCLAGTRSGALARALEGYLAGKEGQEKLRDVFLAGAFLSTNKYATWASVPRDLKKKDGDYLGFGLDLVDGTFEGVSYETGRYNWNVKAGRGGGGGNGSLREDGNVTLLNILDLLKHLEPGTFPVPDHPELECTIYRKGDHHVRCQVIPKRLEAL